MTQSSDAPTATETVAARVKELRQKQGLSAQKLAERCAANGAPHLDRSIIANLETGRRGNVSIDEVLILALALNVAPVHLFVPVEDSLVQVGKWTLPGYVVREWVRGGVPLPSQDSTRYHGEVPDREWETFEKSGRPSSTPDEVRAFIEKHGGKLIVEPEAGS